MFARAVSAFLLLAFCLGVVASAEAQRKPTQKERTAILSAVKTRISCGDYPPGSCRFVVRVSTVRRGWAAAYVRPRRGWENTVQPDVASVRRRDGRWRRYQVGNGGGCNVPAGVRRDLKLACY